MPATAPPPAPPKQPPPPPPPARPSPNGLKSATPTSKRPLSVNSGFAAAIHKTVIYSSGGAGKTSLAANIQQLGIKPLFLDLEQGSKFCNVDRIDSIESWDELRSVLHDDALCSQYGAIVIDSLTRAEEMALAWTLANVPHEKGHFVTSIEGYGFGKGLTHLYETFLLLLSDLDAQVRAGRHVICTAHDCTTNVPNPAGDDWLRWEPRLQSPASGKSSIRSRVREWSDHTLFIGYDTFVNADGKGVGSGTRTIFPTEKPTHLAKSRSLSREIPYELGSAELWKQLLGVTSNATV